MLPFVSMVRVEKRQQHICPFCSFETNDDYALLLHVETLHNEDDSPFVIKDGDEVEQRQTEPATASLETPNKNLSEEAVTGTPVFVECTEDGCGELVQKDDLQMHLDLHMAELVFVEEAGDVSGSAGLDRRSQSVVRLSKDTGGTRLSTDLAERPSSLRAALQEVTKSKRSWGSSSRSSSIERKKLKANPESWKAIFGWGKSKSGSSTPTNGQSRGRLGVSTILLVLKL
jgi:hypothetical protein